MTVGRMDPIPNSFQLPNVYVDLVLPHLSGTETKVLLFLARMTFGWQKREDRIAVSQIAAGAGVSRRAVLDALHRLVALGVVLVEAAAAGKPSIFAMQLDGARFALPADPCRNCTGAEIAPVQKLHRTRAESARVTAQRGANSAPTETQGLRNPLTKPSGATPHRAPAPSGAALRGEDAARFGRWYAAYPKHERRPDAERAWARLRPDDALTARLIADVAARRAGRKWGAGYVEQPATYLNQHVWEDDIEPVAPARGGSGNGRAPADEIEATFGPKLAPSIRMLQHWQPKGRREEP